MAGQDPRYRDDVHSFLSGLNSQAFSIWGEHVLWSDMVGNLLGLLALALGWRRLMATWAVQLLSGLVLVAAYADKHLPGGVGKQVIVVVVSLWGWYQWRRGRQPSGALSVRFATWRERGLLVLATGIGTVAVASFFLSFRSLSYSPWEDAYIFVGTLAAMYAQARRWVEFWFAWLAVDAVGIPLAFDSGLPFSGMVYGIYLVLVILGMRAWWLSTRQPPEAVPPPGQRTPDQPRSAG
jgi:nicotinamide mononucleotide transporter